jgi:hypothetical protein
MVKYKQTKITIFMFILGINKKKGKRIVNFMNYRLFFLKFLVLHRIILDFFESLTSSG